MNPVDLMVQIIRENGSKDIWQESPMIGYRSLGNTSRGEIGEQFIRRYLAHYGIKVGNGNRTSPIDMRIDHLYFEVKTESLGANGTFQFNHVRTDRQYDHLICLGICPQEVVFNMWPKAMVVAGRAGTLVEMAQGHDVTFKLTKRLVDMVPINRLLPRIQAALSDNPNS